MSSFLIALCHEGAERALKADVDAAGLRPAFQGRGLVSFKSDVALDESARVGSALARFSALSLGRSTLTEARARARAEKAVFHRVSLTGDAADGARSRPGDRVLTLIEAEGSSWLTAHVHDASRSGFPAERPPLTLPAKAPSRAWLKIEEAIARFSLPIGTRSRVLEIGSAPGGASWALLSRDATVVGIDPNEMDPRVTAHPRFSHVRAASTALDPAAISGAFDWLLLDVNVPPGTALRGALPFLRQHARSLRGAVLTFKLGRWDLVSELPGWLARVRRALPRSRIEAWSGSHHAQEIGVVVTRDV